ncbi:MAG: hypothetical protein ACK5M4_00760 [Pseudorhodobacter sp.]
MTDVKDEGQAVFRRKVFYIPGYDPFHPRRYRELYRKEGRMQARISRYALDQRPLARKGRYGWQVEGQMEGGQSQVDIEVLVWSDIVKGSMGRGIAATYLQLCRTAWAYIGSGALFRLMLLRKGPVIAALYPVIFLLLQLCLAIVVFVAVLAFNRAVLPAPYGTMIGVVCGLLWGYGLLYLFRRHDRRFFAYYLMHDYAFSAQKNGANPPELEARMRAFGRYITEALEGDFDEVLVVGHSSGAHLGVSILADLIRAGLPRKTPPLSFLSLGQVVPMLSFLPRADRLRADLNYLCQRDEITWVDVTAPGDGCAFALCDPVSVSGVAPKEGKRWPLVISAAFTQSLSAKRWAALRRRFFRLHFQYLCAFDHPRGYDYFRITAGPKTLGERYAGRAASKSRIDRAVSGYTNMAA